MLHLSPHSGWSSASAPPTLVALRSYVDVLAEDDFAADDIGAPRRVVWPDPLRRLAAQLQLTQDALDPDADFGAWVMPA